MEPNVILDFHRKDRMPRSFFHSAKRRRGIMQQLLYSSTSTFVDTEKHLKPLTTLQITALPDHILTKTLASKSKHDITLNSSIAHQNREQNPPKHEHTVSPKQAMAAIVAHRGRALLAQKQALENLKTEHYKLRKEIRYELIFTHTRSLFGRPVLSQCS